MNPKSRITPEEQAQRAARIAKADAIFDQRYKGTEQIEIALYARLQDSIPLWRIDPLPHGSNHFEVYFFFETNDELEASKTNGKREEIERVTWEEIERAGRGKPPETKVTFVYDSDENVIENYEGDYQNRLR
jgi:hypothetical protein